MNTPKYKPLDTTYTGLGLDPETAGRLLEQLEIQSSARSGLPNEALVAGFRALGAEVDGVSGKKYGALVRTRARRRMNPTGTEL